MVASAYAEAVLLIQRTREACRRPMFTEIALVEEKQASRRSLSPHHSAPQDSPRSHIRSHYTQKRAVSNKYEDTWEELLSHSAALLHSFTDQQYAEILKLASILLIGYILPFSTGNEYYLMEANPTPRALDPEFSIGDYVLELSLEDRLKVALLANYQSATTATPRNDGNISNSSWERAFDSFLRRGLGPLLSCNRPFPKTGQEPLDLLHIFAMIVSPSMPLAQLERCYPKEVKKLDQEILKFNASRADTVYQRLAQHPAAMQFQMSYLQQVCIIEFIANCSLLTGMFEEVESAEGLNSSSLKLRGAMLHLRSSLRTFANESTVRADRMLAYSALVSVAAQTQNASILTEEWDILLHDMVDDRQEYDCANGHGEREPAQAQKQTKTQQSAFHLTPASQTCLHLDRGHILSLLIQQAYGNGTTILDSFANHALASLVDAVEWQVDGWTKSEEDSEDVKLYSPCLLVALLNASKYFFRIWSKRALTHNDDPRNTLIESAAMVLSHGHSGIVKAASSVLIDALTYGRELVIDPYIPVIYKVAKVCLVNSNHASEINQVITLSCQRSPSLTKAMFKFLIDLIEKGKVSVENLSLMSSIAANRSVVVSVYTKQIMALCDHSKVPIVVSHLLATLISARQASLFDEQNEGLYDFLLQRLNSQGDDWVKYKLARHSMVSGEYGLAAILFSGLLDACGTEHHYLWISSLQAVAEAEDKIANASALGIPGAVVNLNSALSYFESLELGGGQTLSFDFQIRFLRLRLEYLELATVLRQRSREMRLTGSGPAKTTRSYTHLQNTIRGFTVLARRYYQLNQQYGLTFRSKQSTLQLRTLGFTAEFMACAAQAAFSDVLSSGTSKKSMKVTAAATFLPTVSSHPTIVLMRRFDELVVKEMDAGMDPRIRATAMLEVIDGILLAFCFPFDFFVPKAQCRGEVHLVVSPNKFIPVPEDHDGIHLQSPCDILIDSAFSVSAHGCISQPSERTNISTPCWGIIVWYRLYYAGPTVDDEPDQKEDEGSLAIAQQGSSLVPRAEPDLTGLSPARATVPSNGRFFLELPCPPISERGMYTMEIRLGCMDASATEWEIFVPEHQCSLQIRVGANDIL